MYGQNIKISIFGQSHSEAIGVVIDGLPSGFKIDFDELQRFMERRAPGKQSFSTQRREADIPEIVSGLSNGVTCGAPLMAIIRNKDARSSDYANLKDVPRPGHADYTAQLKYKGAQDTNGGGHFSGRLTGPPSSSVNSERGRAPATLSRRFFLLWSRQALAAMRKSHVENFAVGS
jgi:chorismate synthase